MLLYVRCKNGARNTLFLWVGADSSPDNRAALAIQSVHVSGEDVAADHVQVSQGSEPPLLAAVCMHLLDRPLCVVKSVPEISNISRHTLVMEVSMPHLGLVGQCPAAHQVCMETGAELSVANMSAERARIRIELDLTAKTFTSQVYVGEAALPSVVDAANSVGKMAGNIANALLEERVEREVDFEAKGTTQVTPLKHALLSDRASYYLIFYHIAGY